MSMSGDVRQALVDTPLGLSRDALFAQSGAADERKFRALLSQLKGVHKIKVGGTRSGEDYFVLDDWPESALRENFDSNRPTQRTITSREFIAQGGDDMKPEKKKRGAKDNGSPGAPRAPAPDLGAEFAINMHGELGITQENTKIMLSAAAFSALRAFIAKTEEVWK